MIEELDEVDLLFKSVGWKAVTPSEDAKKAGLVRVYTKVYAAVGVAFHESASDLLARWADCQVAMAEFKNAEIADSTTDLYFVLIDLSLDEYDDFRPSLQTLVNDTHVCRKIIVEKRGRPFEVALQDTPFFVTSNLEVRGLGDVGAASLVLGQNNISQALMDDLAKRSASVVLDNLLNRKYEK